MRLIASLLFFINLLLLAFPFFAEEGQEFQNVAKYSTIKALELLYVDAEVEGRRCFLMGPYDSKDSVGLNLSDLTIRDSLLPHSYKRAPRFMVYIPSFDSQSAAVKYSKSLLARSIDNYVVVGGVAHNTISLGVFENIDAAKRLYRKLRAKKLSVEIKKMPRAGVEYWRYFVVEPPKKRIFEATVREKFKNNKELLEISCKGVDS